MDENYLPRVLLTAALVTGASLVPLAYSDYPPPLQQIRDGGVSPEDVQCNAGLVHAVRASGAHVCVKETTAERLGWEIFVAEAAALGEEAAGDAADGDGGYVAALDYLWYGKITLQGIEKMPNPTGVWMPVTRGEAESTVMPRLAGAIGDAVILPASYDSGDFYEYETEMGNAIRALYNPEYPDVILRLDYYVYDNISYGEQDGFLLGFMEGAGFQVYSIDTVPPNSHIYGNLISMYVSNIADFEGPHMLIRFLGWTNDPPPGGYMMPERDLERRAYDFAVRNAHLFDSEWCTLKLYDEADIFNLHVHNGVPVYDAIVGNCYVPLFPDGGPRAQSVQIEAVTGEIAWFSNESFLIEDWIDHTDIPESAKVGQDDG